jgi:hypothetical protein
VTGQIAGSVVNLKMRARNADERGDDGQIFRLDLHGARLADAFALASAAADGAGNDEGREPDAFLH